MNSKEYQRFIYFITHCKGLTNAQKAKRDKLLARDAMSYVELQNTINTVTNSQEETVPVPIEDNTETLSESAHSPKEQIHTPREMVRFLNNFSLKGKTLKYTTHPWDESENKYEDFDSFVKQYKKELNEDLFWKYQDGKRNIIKCCPQLFYLIDNFLLKNNMGDNYWGDGYKAGYLTNDILKKWMSENPDKQPFQMPLSFFPKEFIPYKEGKNMDYFEDLVNEFKGLIEFRGKQLFHVFRKAFKGQGVKLDMQHLSSLEGKTCYSYTRSIEKAVGMIASNIKNRGEFPNVDIWADEHALDDGAKVLDIHVLHVESFSNAKLDDDKLMCRGKGGMMDIRRQLSGLCDFSVISTFDGDNGRNHYQIDYLYEINPDASPRVVQLPEGTAKGFEYLLRFYKP